MRKAKLLAMVTITEIKAKFMSKVVSSIEVEFIIELID